MLDLVIAFLFQGHNLISKNLESFQNLGCPSETSPLDVLGAKVIPSYCAWKGLGQDYEHHIIFIKIFLVISIQELRVIYLNYWLR